METAVGTSIVKGYSCHNSKLITYEIDLQSTAVVELVAASATAKCGKQWQKSQNQFKIYSKNQQSNGGGNSSSNNSGVKCSWQKSDCHSK